jgi:hypothetical protein
MLIQSNSRLAIVGAFLLVLTSCGIPGKKYINGGASVTVDGARIGVVRDNVIDVMREDDYTVASGYGDELIFERPGQKTDMLLYSGLFKPDRVISRATILLKPKTSQSVLVQGTACVIRDEGGMQSEEEGWLMGNGRYRLQGLLEEAKARAERETAATAERRAQPGALAPGVRF